jgi:predicted nucleic-acid-binding protein
MIALDTNVIVRWILRDDEAQAVVAEGLLATPCWIGITILLELGWVLLRRGQLPREVIFEALTLLISLPEVHVERAAEVRWALGRFRDGADLADVLHLAATAKVDHFATFDRKLAKRAGDDAPVPVRTLT